MTMTTSTSHASTEPVPLSFEVFLETLGSVRIAAWAFPPHYQNDLLPALWVFCIPGGTYRGRAYYDRQAPGYVPFAYSMARHLASNGIGSLVIDNLGTGQSTGALSSEAITAEVLAAAYQQVVAQLKNRLATRNLLDGLAAIPEESLFLAGIGHSMGAFILTHLQGRYPVFDAAIHLGLPYQPKNVQAFYASFGDEQALQTMIEQFTLHAGDESFARENRVYMRPIFYSKDVPVELIQADEADATTVPVGLFHDVVTQTEVAAQFAQLITCPVYLGFGQLELSSPHEEVASFSGSKRVTLFVLDNAAHCANFAPNRYQLWNDVISWLRYRSVHTRPPLNRTLGTLAG